MVQNVQSLGLRGPLEVFRLFSTDNANSDTFSGTRVTDVTWETELDNQPTFW